MLLNIGMFIICAVFATICLLCAMDTITEGGPTWEAGLLWLGYICTLLYMTAL